MVWDSLGSDYVKECMEEKIMKILQDKNLLNGRKLIMENYINTQAQAVLKYQV